MRRASIGLLLPLLIGLLLLVPARVSAGPVSWKEVPPTPEGRQWWDEGSLRRNRSGHLTVLSRFQAAPEGEASAAAVPSLDPPPADPGRAGRPGSSPSGSASAVPGAVGEASGPAVPLTPSPASPAGSLPAGVDQLPVASRRAAAPLSRLYVMELDCDQSLYRDISINGLPQFGATWQPTGSDDLTAEVLRQACAAEAA